MTRSTVVRLRALGLPAAVLALAAAAICSVGLDSVTAVSHNRTGPAVVDQDSAILVALALGCVGRRDSSRARASYAVAPLRMARPASTPLPEDP